MIYSCCTETLEFHLNFNLPVLFAFPTTLFSDLNSLLYWITSFFPSQWASPGSSSWLPAHDSRPHFIWVLEALARFGFLPFSQLLGPGCSPSLCYHEAACRSWPGQGHLSTANPHADTHLSTRITDRQTAWTEQEVAEPNFPRKLLNPYHFPLSIPMLLSQTDHRVTRHSRRRCFCSIAITSIKKHGLKPFHQKTISEQFKGRNCRRTAGTSVSS